MRPGVPETECAVDSGLKLSVPVGLPQHRARAELDREPDQHVVVGSRHDDDRLPETALTHQEEQVEPASARHIQIGHYDIDLGVGQSLERSVDGCNGRGRVTGVLEQKRGEDAAREIVVDDEDSCHALHGTNRA